VLTVPQTIVKSVSLSYISSF